MIAFKPSTRLTRRVLTATAAVALWLASGAATPAGAENLCVSMANGGGQVAGVQVDLKWDGSCMKPDQGSGTSARCTADPNSGKDIRTAIKPGPTLKAIFFSMADTSPIPDGDLFCCSFTSLGQSADPCCGLNMGNVLGSDSGGTALTTDKFTLLATMNGKACAATQGGGGGGGQQGGGVRSGVGGAGVVAPPVVSAPGGNAPTGGGGQQAPPAGGQAAPAGGSGQPAPGSQPGLGGLPAGMGAPGVAPGKPEAQEAPTGMDQVQRALDQLRGAPTAVATMMTPRAESTPKPAAAPGTPTAKAHGTPTAPAKKTAEAQATASAKTTPATPKATPDGKD